MEDSLEPRQQAFKINKPCYYMASIDHPHLYTGWEDIQLEALHYVNAPVDILMGQNYP